MKEVFLYNHGGSENHGCEALARTACQLLGGDKKISLLSEAPQQDYFYNVHKIAEIKPASLAVSKLSPDFIKAYIHLKRTGDYFPMDTLSYTKPIKKLNKGDVEISIGGDIYCYEDYPKFIRLHSAITKQGCKSVLLGCSLEKRLFDDPAFLADMKRYDYISARESLTYQLLQDAGFTNIGLNPDAAFSLPVEYLPLPDGFIENNTIGINVSPLVVRKEIQPGIVYKNFINLIQWILDNTDCNVALIPHVVWESNDDRTVLNELYKYFDKTGRVVLVQDCNCMQLKGYISRCKLFVGARTHATIAAYSTMVPTLVLGYSIKSKGIAKDLFGTYENYVLPVEDLKNENDLVKAFDWILENENSIKDTLALKIPEYVNRINDIPSKIEKALGVKI